jgi:hypothetical protein
LLHVDRGPGLAGLGPAGQRLPPGALPSGR